MPYSRGVSEGSILFYSGGHNHNGTSSALIATEAYSIYDFIVGFAGSNERQIKQQNNFNNLKTVISNVIKTDVLGPSGVRLSPNSIETIHIVTGAVTAEELSANLVLVNNVIRSNNFDGTILANGSITGQGTLGWAITSAGDAVFSSASIRGAIVAASLETTGIDISSSGNLTAANFALYANGQIQNGNFSVSPSGVLSATGATISGTVIASSVSTPGIDIDTNGNLTSNANTFGIYANGAIFTSSNNFRVDASGNLTATNANIAGYIEADSGSVGNWDISAGNIISSNGKISLINDAGDTVIIAQSAVGTFAAINGDGSIELQNGGYGASQSMNGASYVVTDSIGRSTTMSGSGISGNLGYVGVNGIISSGDIYAGLSYLSSSAIYSQGSIQAIGTITASGSGVQYGASNLLGGFPIAFGYSNGTGQINALINNDTAVSYYLTKTGISDRRLKDNIEPISSAVLNKFYSIKTYEFDWNDKAPHYIQNTGRSVGVIADELKELYPTAVIDDEAYEGWIHRYDEHPEGFSIEEMEKFGSDFYEFVPGEGVWQKPRYASVDYTFLIPHLISAVHDLNNRVKELESKV